MTCGLFFLKKSNEALEVMKKFQNLVETKTNHKLKMLQTNYGREFLSQTFLDFCNGFSIG
jgi:hypothetical protein